MTTRLQKSTQIIALCSTLLLMSGCEQEPPPAPLPPAVIVQELKTQFVPLFTDYLGQTESSSLIEIRARVDGFLTESSFTEGSRVEEGDLLFKIDPRPYESKVRQNEAKVERYEATLAKTKRDIERLEPLYKRNAASQLDYDNALSANEEAEADLASARAELVAAQLELSYTEIRSPITGMVGARAVPIGSLVGSKGVSLLTTVQTTDPMWVTFNMTAEEYLNVKRRISETMSRSQEENQGPVDVGNFINIYLPDGSRYEYQGGIEFTDPSIDPYTGTFEVRGEIPNPDRLLLPGQYVKVRLLRAYRYDAILIPEKAVQIEQGGAYVFLIRDDGTAERRFIDADGRYDGSLIVNQGVSAGDRIVIEGIHKVRHNEPVQIVEPEPMNEDTSLMEDIIPDTTG